MTTRNKSQGKSQNQRSKSKSHSNKSFQDEEEEFFNNIMEIDLTKPRTAYILFSKDQYAGMEEGDKKLGDKSSKIGEKWKTLGKSQREKYVKKAEEDRKRYDNCFAKVKKFLLNPDSAKEHRTAFNLFKDNYIYEELSNNNLTMDEAKKNAKAAWDSLNKNEKDEWKDQLEREKQVINELGDFKHGKSNPYTVYINHMVKNERIPLEEAREKWKKTSNKERSKYEKIAEENNLENDKLRDLYEIVSGKEPKKPVGSFGLFMAEMSNSDQIEDKQNFIKSCRDLWVNLPKEEVESYERKHKALSLKYQIKKEEFNKMNKGLKPKSASGYNLFCTDQSKILREKYGESHVFSKGSLFSEVASAWHKLGPTKKEEYNNKAKEIREENLDKSSIYNNKPEKPSGPYQVFVKEYLENNKKKLENMIQADRFRKAAEAWRNTSDKDKKKYKEKHEVAKEKYDDEMIKFTADLEAYENDDANRSRRKSKSKVGSYLQSQRMKSMTKLISSKSKIQASQNRASSKKKGGEHTQDHHSNINTTNQSQSNTNKSRGKSKK